MDDSLLTLPRLRSMIPSGLSSEDSAALATSIIDGWLEDRLFDTYLSHEPAEEQAIERKVADYRRKLRLEAYRRRIRRQHRLPVHDDSVRAYYASHRHDMIAERPLVKGMLVKVAEDYPGLQEIRHLAVSATAPDIARLNEIADEEGMIQVEYFGDSWIEFDVLASEIPYSFGDPDRFLERNRDFSVSHGENLFFLHVYQYLPSGSEMPFEFAEIQIRDILQESRLEAYRRGLLKALREKATRDGRLSLNT